MALSLRESIASISWRSQSGLLTEFNRRGAILLRVAATLAELRDWRQLSLSA